MWGCIKRQHKRKSRTWVSSLTSIFFSYFFLLIGDVTLAERQPINKNGKTYSDATRHLITYVGNGPIRPPGTEQMGGNRRYFRVESGRSLWLVRMSPASFVSPEKRFNKNLPKRWTWGVSQNFQLRRFPKTRMRRFRRNCNSSAHETIGYSYRSTTCRSTL